MGSSPPWLAHVDGLSAVVFIGMAVFTIIAYGVILHRELTVHRQAVRRDNVVPFRRK